MKRGLCLNTSSSEAEACLVNGLNEESIEISSPHSEKLMPAVDFLMSKHDLEVSDFDAFGVVVGPGSFTGVRIGVAVIKGMAVVNKHAKLVAITSFDLIAQNVSAFDFLAVLDSGNEDRYVAEYEKGKLAKIFSMQTNQINEYAKQKNIEIFANVREQSKLADVNAQFIELKKDTLSEIFQNKCAKNEFCALNELAPVYVKLSQAERQRSEKILENLSIESVSDYEQLKDIENSCFKEPAWSENVFKEELMQNYKFYYVAKYEEKNIGYVGFERMGDDLNVQKIAVLEDYRNCGVASKLLEKVFEYQLEQELNKVFLEVDEKNKTAIKFYEKFGFKTISRRENYYKNGDACFVMLKDK